MADDQERPVARLVAVSLDCADPRRLADFYLALLGGRQMWASGSSVGVEVPGMVLVPQRVDDYVPPVWPGASVVHLDLTADDIDAAAQRAIALGATEPAQPDPRWRVLLDPAGHPFCLTPFVPRG
jgi:Glyoxalase-like domain